MTIFVAKEKSFTVVHNFTSQQITDKTRVVHLATSKIISAKRIFTVKVLYKISWVLQILLKPQPVRSKRTLNSDVFV